MKTLKVVKPDLIQILPGPFISNLNFLLACVPHQGRHLPFFIGLLICLIPLLVLPLV